MVERRYYIVNSARVFDNAHIVMKPKDALQVIRREQDRPLVAWSDQALKKAIQSGLW